MGERKSARFYELESMEDRIKRFSKQDGDHILWTGSLTHGYGSMTYRQKTYRVHRQVWILKNGPIPEGLVVMHKCDIKNCINPEHLELGTDKDNIQDMIKKGRKNPKTKFSEETIKEVFRLAALKERNDVIATKLGMSSGYVCNILKGRVRKSTKF